MAYNNFSMTKALTDLQLTKAESDLFSAVPAHPLPESLLDTLNTGLQLALPINTEKAKSEFIIAPLLVYVKSLLKNQISLFSGIDLNVDAERGLTGVCDFIISRANSQFLLTAPLITIVEAKNDNIHNGLGQCIAEMYAAQTFNRTHTPEIERVYGIVTIGSSWKFFKLEGNCVTFDLPEYFIDNPQKIIGIILHIIQHG